MQIVINEPSICRLGITVTLTARCPKCDRQLDIVTIEGSSDASAICHQCRHQETLLGLSAADLKNRVFKHLAAQNFAK